MIRSAAAMVALMVCGVTTAATIYVPGDYASIQDAIDASANGDEILVAPGTYARTGDRGFSPLGKAITIRATGTPEETILDGQGARRVVLCNSGEGADTVIEGFTIMGGNESWGGGVYCYESSPTITGCTISGNTAYDNNGGGIYCDSSNPTITGCTISGNTANETGGGIYCYDSDPTITGCTISGNASLTFGGGIYCSGGGSPTISGCMISGNTAIHGGGIYCTNSSPTIAGCTISNNNVSGRGGGIWCDASSPTISGCEISGNTADDKGGGIYCSTSSHVIAGCTISNNIAFKGGGIYCSASNPTITGCTISHNTANYGGGGIYCLVSNPTITDCDILNNTATERGGGIECNGAYPTIANCTIASNTASWQGGGVYSDLNAIPNISNTIVCGNSPNQIYEFYSDNGGNTISATCEARCDADVTGNDQVVDESDLVVILLLWNQDVDAIDISGDGIIGITDLLMLLESWGPCP